MSPADRLNEGSDRPRALAQLNEVLGREGFEAFYGEDNHCYLRHVGTQTVTILAANPHRPFSKAELERRQFLTAYLDQCSEDALIEEVAPPAVQATWLPPHHRRRAQGQGPGVRQRHLDALHLADAAHSLLRHLSKEGKTRRFRDHQDG